MSATTPTVRVAVVRLVRVTLPSGESVDLAPTEALTLASQLMSACNDARGDEPDDRETVVPA